MWRLALRSLITDSCYNWLGAMEMDRIVHMYVLRCNVCAVCRSETQLWEGARQAADTMLGNVSAVRDDAHPAIGSAMGWRDV